MGTCSERTTRPLRGKSIAHHLFAGYGLVILLLALTWALSSYSVARIDARVAHIVGVSDGLLGNVDSRIKLMDDEETGLRGYLLTGHRQFLQPYVRARQSLPRLRAEGNSEAPGVPGARPLMAAMTDRALAWEGWAARMRDRPPRAPRSVTAIAQQITGKDLFDRFRATASRVASAIKADREREVQQTHQITTTLNRIIAGIFLTAALITFVVSWLTLRAITRPVSLLSRAADAIGGGNLHDPVRPTEIHEFAGLEQRMEQMRLRLTDEAANRRLAEEALRQEADRRAAVIDVQQYVASMSLDLEEVLAGITTRAQQLTGASAAVVEMIEGEDMVYRSASGTAADHLGLRLSRASSISGKCSLSGEVLHCRDSETDEDVDREACRRVGARSMILVPLRKDTETVGVLKVMSPRPHAFSEADVETLQVVGGLLGAAMGHAAAFTALQASERDLQARTREQESFIYTVSHDLRAPLVSLQGLVAILCDDYGADLDGDARRYLERINANASKMQTLLTELLDLARIGRIETEQLPVELDAVVAEVVAQLGSTLESRGAAVRLPASLPAVLGNPIRLSQLFTNLIDNAVHYTPPERKPEIRISANDCGDAWEIIVADNGVGIPEMLRDKVFALFQRLPAGKMLNPAGTGAGLAIVARVVESHGGRIWLESTEGSGSAFHFTLLKPGAATPANPGAVTRGGVGHEAA